MNEFNKKAIEYIKSRVKVNKNGCWIPSIKPRVNGYVRSSFLRKYWYLHRLSFGAFKEDINPGNDVCHKCDVRACCNPEHLFQGTRKDNMQDAVKKGRQASGLSLPQTKLSEKNKKSILHLIKRGFSYIEIAKEFNVSRYRINNVALQNNIRKRSL